jgi:DNA-binding response OmpR family regulator
MGQLVSIHSKRRPTIAVLEDDYPTLCLYQEIFDMEDFHAGIFDLNRDCYRFIYTYHPDLIILDIASEVDSGGRRLLERLIRDMGGVLPPLILATAIPPWHLSDIERTTLKRLRSYYTVKSKPFDVFDLLRTIHHLVRFPAPVPALSRK